MLFRILKKDSGSRARTGILKTTHGEVRTPCFLPIGTKATVKSARNDELKNWGAEMILANTYHLWTQPGDELIARAGGLHKFMNWDGPIFTDSGGFQIFSLGEKFKNRTQSNEPAPFNVRVEEEGVYFQSGSSGNKMELTPEKSVEIQNNLGSDISVVLDEFTGNLDDYEKVKQTVERTTRWAKRAKDKFEELKSANKLLRQEQLQLGIVQGANFTDLRRQSAEEISTIGFDGYCIGGVAVGGETQDKMLEAVNYSIPYLEENKFRHLLGVGTPENIVQAVAHGCDSFDCVIPTREARHGKAYINEPGGYTTLNILKPEFREDFSPLDKTCDCYACSPRRSGAEAGRNHTRLSFGTSAFGTKIQESQNFGGHTRAYLHHLFKSSEILGIRLLTEHNLRFYLGLMAKIRQAIASDGFEKMIKRYSLLSGRATK